MAQIKLEPTITEISGTISKKGIIYRRKKYRDSNGKIIHQGVQEAYVIRKPRNYKKNPPKGAELAHLQLFQEASQRTAQIMQAAQPPTTTQTTQQLNNIPDYYTHEQALELYNHYKTRYLKQLPNKRGCHPDTQAPIDKKTNRPKRYARFDNFVRAMIYQQLKTRQNT